MTIPAFSTLPIEKQFIFEKFRRTVEQDLRMRLSGHCGCLLTVDHRLFWTEFKALQPFLENAPAFVEFVAACKKDQEDPEPETLALGAGNGIILNPDETETVAFSRFLRCNAQMLLDKNRRYGRISGAEDTARAMAELRQEVKFIPHDWVPAWIQAQERLIAWLDAYIKGEDIAEDSPAVQDQETEREPKPLKRGRPPLKHVAQATAMALLPFLGGLK